MTSISPPQKDRLKTLEDVQRKCQHALEEIGREAAIILKWAEENGKDVPRWERVRDIIDDALAFRMARIRKTNTKYLRERGTGLEEFGVE